uniref:F-box domain-containing protein n=1 Tax=Aegilops tauschii subsp. strangulata TaxID=200361 RepID=A0A453IR48_AEGTS
KKAIFRIRGSILQRAMLDGFLQLMILFGFHLVTNLNPAFDSRFPESAQLRFVCWLEIHGKIHSKLLSRGSAYATYMVYKLDDESYGLDWPADASVSIGGTDLARKVCLQPNPQRSHAEDVVLPRERGDGWMELELGEFVCEGDEDGDVSFGLAETKRLNGKGGLIMQGIEIRHKN